MLLDFLQNNLFTIEVETTPSCNFSCNFCVNKKHLSFDENKIFNINFDALLQFIDKLDINKTIQIILNGGEPTLHPGLLNFLYQCKLKHVVVNLYTNFSASYQLYKDIQKTNTIIIPTYHINQISIDEFRYKANKLNIKNIYVPIHDIIELNEIQQQFKQYNIKPQLIENFKYSNDELKKLSKNLYIQQQINIFQNIKLTLNKTHICNSLLSYMYINGDGNIYRCMFNEKTKFGNIYNLNEINKKLKYYSFICNTSYCYYMFKSIL